MARYVYEFPAALGLANHNGCSEIICGFAFLKRIHEIVIKGFSMSHLKKTQKIERVFSAYNYVNCVFTMIKTRGEYDNKNPFFSGRRQPNGVP